jgi:trypsin
MPGTGGSGGGAEFGTGGSAPARCDWIPARSTAKTRSRSRPRIVGGQPAPEAAYPWMAALETPSGWQYCGGSVIANRWVLTGAHCQVEPGDVVHVGTVDLRVGGDLIVVHEARHHPGWYGTTTGYDVAVLRLGRDAGVPTVALGRAQLGNAIAIGWGATSEDGSTVPVLQHVTVPVWTENACSEAYAGAINFTMLCAGEEGHDSCQGDSAGPLVQQGVQVGITSWGSGCARPGAPGVYTHVAEMQDWILACTSDR